MSEYKEYTVRVYADRTAYYNSKGQFHREDRPAVEYTSGTKHWYLNGKLHRADGPAVEYFDGYKAWYLNGKCHREDGPAVEWSNGYKEWWLNGKKLTEAEFNQRTNKTSCAGKVVEIDGKKYKLTQA